MSTDSPHSFVVRPQTPVPHLRRQSSLELSFNFTLLSPAPTPLEADEACLIYHRILDDCEVDGIVLSRHGSSDLVHPADPGLLPTGGEDDDGIDSDHDSEIDESYDGRVPLHKLFRALYEYSPTQTGRVNLVRIILHGLFPPSPPSTSNTAESSSERALLYILPRARRWLSYSLPEKNNVYTTLTTFASDFLEGFFVPIKAQGRCTPAVSTLITPTTRSEPGSDQGTPSRLRGLRNLCLLRDGGRCVITGRFDRTHLERERERYRAARRRHPAPERSGVKTEAAHIIPHALNTLSGSETSLSASKCFVWRVLNMFDPGISGFLAGTLIDTPANALMLMADLHDRFGRLECYLQEVHGLPDTYTFHTTRGSIPLDPIFAPSSKYITFRNHEPDGCAWSELPSRRLLALHRACCMMMSMGGAAEYVEALWRDAETLMEKGVLETGGGSNVGLLLRLRGLKDQVGDVSPPDVEREQKFPMAVTVQ